MKRNVLLNFKKNILIVDDQEINRKILAKFLKEDFFILCAENGKQALEILNDRRDGIAAVILDIVMPVMDGYGVLSAMQEDSVLSKIPVIVTTQKEGDETELKALSLGASDFATKPYNPNIIRQRLHNLINLREAIIMNNIMEKDSLTGIYNKDAFYQKAGMLLSGNTDTEFDIIATDIDRFKLVNDIYGTKEGDNLLRFLAKNLNSAAERGGGFCARMSGDQFMTICPRETALIESMPDMIQKALDKYPLDMKIIVKHGVYCINDRTVPVSVMCDRAILAVKGIKGSYDIVVTYYDDSIRTKMLTEKKISDEMKNALEKGQFKVYFQPKYDLATEQIAGAEALVRWIHPDKGIVMPGLFIPAFEKNGFITELDMYIWEKVCGFMREWKEAGYRNVPVSVNVSRKDIYRANLLETLIQMVEQNGLKPEDLHLEITETAYIENQEQLIKIVSDMKDAGFIIEMDDFGSGYSSLNMLTELPINILKLDMSFMQKKSLNDSNILGYIINLAKGMRLSVVAEGVETKEQVNMLKELKCDYAQGYYYAKPMPHDEFTRLLAADKKN